MNKSVLRCLNPKHKLCDHVRGNTRSYIQLVSTKLRQTTDRQWIYIYSHFSQFYFPEALQVTVFFFVVKWFAVTTGDIPQWDFR